MSSRRRASSASSAAEPAARCVASLAADGESARTAAAAPESPAWLEDAAGEMELSGDEVPEAPVALGADSDCDGGGTAA